MKTQKVSIVNRNNLRVAIQIDEPENVLGLAFIAHGFKGFKEQIHIQAFADAFLQNNFAVVRFDATNSLGESEGVVFDATYDTYISDLEDVIAWSRMQKWFHMPFALCGHSMGAQSTTWYAEHSPQEVSLLASMAPPVNYDLYVHNERNSLSMKDWQEKGYKEGKSNSKPGLIVKASWNTPESLKKFDILPAAHNLTMPIINFVGEEDDPCPVSSQNEFMNAVSSVDKTLIIMPSLDHNYRDSKTKSYDETFSTIPTILSKWIRDRIT
jgi:pimeloyl-ACP methyl ester carboxylesterase